MSSPPIILPLIPHIPDRLHELDGIEIENPHSFFLIAEAVVVARQAQNIADPEGISAEQIALERNPVPVPGDHLKDRLMAQAPSKWRTRPRKTF